MSDNPRQDLFLKISKNLVDEELRDLRNYVSGADILAAGFVQKANAHQIFIQMEKEGKLKPGDLSLLAKVLRLIGRHDLAERAEKVAENERKGQGTRKRSAASVSSSSDQEEPAKRRKQQPGTKQVDVRRYFDKVVRGASANWDDLARKLKFEENEIDGIENKKPDHDSRCREMLKRWRNRKGKAGKAATLQTLKKALTKIGHTLTAESLEDLSDSSESSDD